jgi:hypothetical protein
MITGVMPLVSLERRLPRWGRDAAPRAGRLRCEG